MSIVSCENLYQRTHGANCNSQFEDRDCELLGCHVLNVSAKIVLPNMKRNRNNCDHGLFLWKGQNLYPESHSPLSSLQELVMYTHSSSVQERENHGQWRGFIDKIIPVG